MTSLHARRLTAYESARHKDKVLYNTFLTLSAADLDDGGDERRASDLDDGDDEGERLT